MKSLKATSQPPSRQGPKDNKYYKVGALSRGKNKKNIHMVKMWPSSLCSQLEMWPTLIKPYFFEKQNSATLILKFFWAEQVTDSKMNVTDLCFLKKYSFK